ncbi:MAG: hypothetical protein WC829_02825 [Hyphomicrobium sp.]
MNPTAVKSVVSRGGIFCDPGRRVIPQGSWYVRLPDGRLCCLGCAAKERT